MKYGAGEEGEGVRAGWLILLHLGVALVLNGCGSLIQPMAGSAVHPVTAFTGLEQTLAKAPSSGESTSYYDLFNNNKSQQEEARAYIRKRQCLYRTADPPIMVDVDKPLMLTLKGTFTTTGQFQIIAMAPGGSLQASEGAEQSLEWPFQLTTLEGLPDSYLAFKKDILSPPGLKLEEQREFLTGYLRNYAKMKMAIAELTSSFDLAKCPNTRPSLLPKPAAGSGS